MDEVVPQAASGMAIDGLQDDPPWPPGVLLAALRWNWRGIYAITGHPDGGLLITRMDGHGSFRASDPSQARDMILADQAVLPFTPPLEPGALERRTAFQRQYPHVLWTAPSRLHRATWTDADNQSQEEAAPTADHLLSRMRVRGFT
jgi:hypothetical protein